MSPLTPDHVNPERPWPALDELAAVTAEAGYELVQRLTAHPPYVLAGSAWIDPRVRGHVAALADPETGYARDVNPVGLPWQEPDEAWESTGRVDLNAAIDTEGRLTETRSDLDSAFGDWESVREKVAELAARAARAGRLRRAGGAAVGRARSGGLHATPSTWRWRPPMVPAWMLLQRLRIRCGATSSATT